MNGDVVVKKDSKVAMMIEVCNIIKNLKSSYKGTLPADAESHLHLAVVELEQAIGHALYLEAIVR